MVPAEELAALLSEGLDLCVRARKMDAQDRTNAVLEISTAPKEWWDKNLERRAKEHNAMWPDQPMLTKSATIPIWAQDQYERDLAAWERKARAAMTRLGFSL